MEDKIYQASRISEGNIIFPAEIHILEREVMLKIPGFFSGKSRHIVYQQIEGVNIDTPMIGYSTITFVVGGEEIVGHGFTKSEAEEIKEICSERIAATSPLNQTEKISNAISAGAHGSGNKPAISVADELKKLKDLMDEGVITLAEFTAQKIKLLNL